MFEYKVSATRDDSSGTTAFARDASVQLDTSLTGRDDALNPVELLLASLAACLVKGVERSAPTLGFAFLSVAVQVRAVRQDAPPRLQSIEYELIVDTDESVRRLDLLHTNVRKYGTISNTLVMALTLIGTCRVQASSRLPRATGE